MPPPTGGTIPVGQFGEFNDLAQSIPSGTSQLVFKAIQTYGDGTMVSWIRCPTRQCPIRRTLHRRLRSPPPAVPAGPRRPQVSPSSEGAGEHPVRLDMPAL